MILPEPRGDRLHQRGKAFVCTFILVGLCYGALVLGTVSIERPSRTIYREVDLASFAPPAPATLRRTPTGAESPSSEPADAGTSEHVATAQTLDQLDLSRILSADLDRDPDPDGSTDTETPRNGQSNAADTETQIQTAPGGLQGRGDQENPNDLSGSATPGAPGRTPRETSSGAAEIELTEGNEAGGEEVVGRNEQRPATAADADYTVRRLTLEAFGADYENLEVQELVEWMKRHPGELPGGVRQLVRYRPAFLSSVTSFVMDGKKYELYLMCKESLYEVHIVLVDAGASTYLVDRSFQKLSTYLREGQVRRTPEQGVVAIRSERNAASNATSQEFYSLFLSWWETARQVDQ
jgi:hypothetical protein